MNISFAFMRIAGIYMIRNTTNGKVYIGSTRSIYSRLLTHRNQLRAGKHHSFTLQASWNKYGESAFECFIVEIISDFSDLLSREQFWLDIEQPFKANGLNILPTAGSNAGWNHSPEAREKIRISGTGRKYSPAAIANMSEAQSNRSQEWRDSISRGKKGQIPTTAIQVSAEMRRGQPMPEWQREKWQVAMSARTPEQVATSSAKRADALRGRKRPPEIIARCRDSFANRSPEEKAATREKKRQNNLGKKLSPETIAKRQASRKRNALAKLEAG